MNPRVVIAVIALAVLAVVPRVAAQTPERPPIIADRPYVWSPDSKWLAYALVGENQFKNVHVVAVSGGPGKPVSFLANVFSNTISWSPDGTFMLFDSGQRTESTQLARVDLVPRLQHAADHGHAEARMVDVGVARDHDDVAAVPAERIHLGPRGRQEFGRAEARRPVLSVAGQRLGGAREKGDVDWGVHREMRQWVAAQACGPGGPVVGNP